MPPYRDDQAALEARREALHRDLAEATRHAAALADAQRDKENLARELADVEARIARAKAKRMPLLSNLRVASPCAARWEEMTGDDQVRFCGACQKDVYNLSALESRDAERLLAAREGSICVRFYQRADGTIMTADCPVGVRRKRVKRAVLAVAGAGALAASASALFVTTGEPAVMGKMAMPVSTPEGGHVMGEAPKRAPSTAPSVVPVMGGTAAPERIAPPDVSRLGPRAGMGVSPVMGAPARRPLTR